MIIFMLLVHRLKSFGGYTTGYSVGQAVLALNSVEVWLYHGFLNTMPSHPHQMVQEQFTYINCGLNYSVDLIERDHTKGARFGVHGLHWEGCLPFWA
jgi:hypothetical protein